jgi:hypothetical protein
MVTGFFGMAVLGIGNMSSALSRVWVPQGQAARFPRGTVETRIEAKQHLLSFSRSVSLYPDGCGNAYNGRFQR